MASMALQFPQLDPTVELTFTALARILYVEYGAYTTFKWAREVLANPEVSDAPEWAPRMVDYIQADEDIHVRYLRCALAEANARTFRTLDGKSISGAEVIPRLVKLVCDTMGGARAERMKVYRYRHILEELSQRPDGDVIIQQLKALGPVPDPGSSRAA